MTTMAVTATTVRIGECPHCFVSIFSSNQWKAMDKRSRSVSGGREAIEGMCSRCWRFPNARPPMPGEEFIEPVCRGCEATMVTVSHWRKAGLAERAELKDEGYVVASNGDWCRRCRPKEEK